MIIGITGSIATGKSYVGSYFKKQGFQVLDTDMINKRLLQEKKHQKKINLLLFNKKSDILNKKDVSELIFSNEEKRKALEEYIHPLILKEVLKAGKKHKNNFLFVEVPLLFETNFHEYTEKTIVVKVEESIQIRRLMKRDNISREQAYQRIHAMMSQEEKIKRATFVVDNSFTYLETNKQLDEILKGLTGGKNGNL